MRVSTRFQGLLGRVYSFFFFALNTCAFSFEAVASFLPVVFFGAQGAKVFALRDSGSRVVNEFDKPILRMP